MSVRSFQDKLIHIAGQKCASTPLSDRVKKAFYEVPRHNFVVKYRNWSGSGDDWVEVTENNLSENLSLIYGDHPLVIFGKDEDFNKIAGTQLVSTISQPSFVLRLIDILKIEKGHKVFELGGGSGWNAALMGKMVGPEGKVISVEIIPDLVRRAKLSIESVNLQNVKIYEGDGGDGWTSEAPFDRVMFTAGSYDLPQSLFNQIKVGGLLLFILKNKGGGDNLILLEKKESCFESLYSMPCEFVPVTGKYHIKSMEELPLSSLLKKAKISDKKISERSFWWSSGRAEEFYIKTSGYKSFLTISNSNYTPILDNPQFLESCHLRLKFNKPKLS